ncbi:MAG: glycogen/starch/alpha-glucan phosphorylase [Oscillospiraceae bacterium]|nr:glycogen/starch/alpha-glucan phosphorylase [Oscillospiraceae bacterium]
MKINDLKAKLSAASEKEYRCAPSACTPEQLHNVLSSVVMEELAPVWDKSKAAHDKARKASYLSMEFLVGRAVYNNLLCLGLLEDADSALSELGAKLSDMEEIEDAALGNGGLGRLAACFLDSAATLDLPLDGYGIRYKYGLFKQGIKDGFQTETADNWQKYGDPWSIRCERDTVVIRYGDGEVNAVPYDYPVIGYGTENVGTLRLWQAEAVEEFDFDLFNRGSFSEASEAKRYAEDISRVLYPNDETREGKKLRLRQEYFFSAAAVADLIRKHKAIFGSLDSFAEYNSIQMNDTHPVIALPEFIRVLIREEGYTFDKAFEMAQKVFAYTNHTIMPEALEKWEANLIEEVVPDVYAVIIMLNEKFESEMFRKKVAPDKKNVMKLINGGTVHMANIAMFGSSYVNGVAQIHSDLLKTTVLKEWYEVYPERFQNKTNGITQRRWLALCNKELSALLTELLGSDEWITDLDKLKELKKYAEDEKVLRRFMDIKHEKKVQLAEYIEKCEGIKINPDAIFDIQIKRLHEYKRQLLNALSILYLYYEIKDGNVKDFTPTVFIFGAKAAPGYYRAKGIIKFINEIAKIVNSDPDTKDLIQVVFISNYRVSYAEKLVAACDVSEQISTAGTEASGTGNMKLMLNGAVTLGTMDGANVEIVEEAGEENNYIFGARVEELEKILPEYDPRSVSESDAKIKRVLDALIDGTVSDGGNKVFRELYFSLMEGASWHKPDNYYLLGDLDSYVKAKLKSNADYKDSLAFAKKCWINVCSAGKFSSDRTIAQYAEEIWHIKPVKL